MRGNQWRAERGIEGLPVLQEGDYLDHLTPAILLSLNTGLRRGELTVLEWSDINLDGKMLTVRAAAAKSGKTRHIPLNAEAVAAVKHVEKAVGEEGWERQSTVPVQRFQDSLGGASRCCES